MSEDARFGELYGQSKAMRAAFDLLGRAAPTDLAIVLLGETGTGKELAARVLHAESTRASGPFVVVDCGAIAATLIESELFGHERAAFTGAEKQRRGAFETAHRGTVFLDEIGELPLELQPKLLRVLERREVQRLGASRPTSVDVRIVCATHRDLASMVNEGTFREDLFFRLAEMVITLPPLRERRDDIPLLAGVILKDLADNGGPAASISDACMGLLTEHDWPGNVRQLRNVLRRAAVMSEDGTIQNVELGATTTSSTPTSALIDESLPLKEARDAWNGALEREYLERVLSRCGDDLDRAAAEAGMHRKSLERLLRRHGLRTRNA